MDLNFKKKPENTEPYIYNKAQKEKQTKVPVRRGCKNETCFCTGACDEIVGYRDKLPGEL